MKNFTDLEKPLPTKKALREEEAVGSHDERFRSAKAKDTPTGISEAEAVRISNMIPSAGVMDVTLSLE